MSLSRLEARSSPAKRCASNTSRLYFLIILYAVLSWIASFRQNHVLVSTNNMTRQQHEMFLSSLLSPQKSVSSLSTNPNNSKSLPHLLSVPFYVYEDLLWQNGLVIGGENFLKQPLEYMSDRNADDYWFTQAALVHPLRTRDPSQAKIFVLPLLLNTLTDELIYFRRGMCWQELCGIDLLHNATRHLHNSPWFQRHQGRDHIVVNSAWGNSVMDQHLGPLSQCHMISFENFDCLNSPQAPRERLASFYAGSSCPIQKENTTNTVEDDPIQDLVFVGRIAKDNHMFENRLDACGWLWGAIKSTREKTAYSSFSLSRHCGANRRDKVVQRCGQKLGVRVQETSRSSMRINITMKYCGQGPRCPSLSLSRFSLHMAGDTPGSNRLIDSLLTGTVPIFTDEQQYQVLPRWIDWESLSVFANVSDRGQFLTQIQRIVSDRELYEEKRANIRANQALFDWRQGGPFDVYMFMLQCRLYPNTCSSSSTTQRQSPYPALQLPTIDELERYPSTTATFSTTAANVSLSSCSPISAWIDEEELLKASRMQKEKVQVAARRRRRSRIGNKF